MIQEGVQKVLASARVRGDVQKFNMDGTPQRATDLAEPPPAPRPLPHSTEALRSMAIPVSPLAVPLPELPPIAGVTLGATAAGIRYQGRTDLVMAEFAPGTTVAGVFTRNKCPGAPVDWCRASLPQGRARALVVNAGNANVFTGRAGADAAKATAQAAAELVGCPPRAGVPRLDRRDRRAAAARADRRGPARRCTERCAKTRGRMPRAAS